MSTISRYNYISSRRHWSTRERVVGSVCRSASGHRAGHSHPRATADSEQVAMARALHEQGYGYKHIGQLLNVSPHTVRDWIIHRAR